MAANPGLDQATANSAAWRQGNDLLKQAVTERLDFAFETTLGGSTIPRLLVQAAMQDIGIYVWYVGLSSPELHIARVRSRVRQGGHDIPEQAIRRRFEHSRLNLIAMLPALAALRMHDNSAEADPADGIFPAPALVLHTEHGKILNPDDLHLAPDWAKPIVAAAMKQAMK